MAGANRVQEILQIQTVTQGNVVLRTSGESSVLSRPAPSRLFSPDGYSLPGTSTGASAGSLSLFGRFVQKNADLLTIIDQDDELLRRATQAGFTDRSDLLDILGSGVSAALPSESPITSRFLSENVQVASLLAFNLGGLRDTVATDEAVAADLADGQTIQTALLRQIAETAANQTGGRGGLDQAYFEANPLAAAYLLSEPTLTRRIANDSSDTTAETFKQRFKVARDSIVESVAQKAGAILDNPTGYSNSYLRLDEEFSSLLVGSAALPENADLPIYLRTHPELSFDRVDVSELLRSYEVDKASKYLPSNSPIDKAFLSQNVGLALVINRHEDVRTELIADLPRLRALEANTLGSSGQASHKPGKLALTHENELFSTYSRSSQQERLSFYF